MTTLRFRTLTAGAAVAVTAASAVTGCGSSGGAGTGDEIVLGALGPYTGTFATTYGAVPDVLKAWEKTVNAAGGVKGRRVKVIAKDIGAETGAGTAAVRRFVQRDRVVAIVANQDKADTAWARFAAGQGVPVLSATSETGSYIDPNNFNAQGSPFAVVYGMGDQVKKAGGRLGIAYCAEQPSCAQQTELMKSFVKAQGVTVPVSTKVPASTADFTAYCQQFKDAGVNAVFNSLSNELAERMNTSCAEQGVTARQIISGSLTNLDWKTDPVYRDSVVLDVVAPFFDTGVPGVRAYREALRKYAPSMIGTEKDNSEALRAWASMQMFAAAAGNVPGQLTSESLKQAMYAVKGQTLDGIVPPIGFTAGRPYLAPCYFRWSPFGEFRSLDGAKPTCVPASTFDPLVRPVVESMQK
jgi:branched-chain amino acid transport system substrate-binding protein